MIDRIRNALDARKALIIAGVALLAVLAALVLARAIVSDIRKGGLAEGRAQAQEAILEKGDEENAARRRVRDCRAAGGLWDDAAGRCAMPQAGR